MGFEKKEDLILMGLYYIIWYLSSQSGRAPSRVESTDKSIKIKSSQYSKITFLVEGEPFVISRSLYLTKNIFSYWALCQKHTINIMSLRKYKNNVVIQLTPDITNIMGHSKFVRYNRSL